jgi:hypothetical protein
MLRRWISMFGGLPIMMGRHGRSEALFYYFRLEDHILENHLLRLIDKHRGDEKAGLRRDAVRSQVINVLEAQAIKETGNEED